jgi:signal transduction histidine kinase
MMQSIEPTVLLIGQDSPLCGAVRDALERSETGCHVAAVATFAAARRSVADFSPDVIVLEESSLPEAAENSGQRSSQIEDVVTTLAGFAPVVVLGESHAPAGLSALIAAGAAEFIVDAQSDMPAAAACVRKRLQSVRRLSPDFAEFASGDAGDLLPTDNFGELLRHELNNPLTGILGNAELLLAEARRQRDSRLPEGSIKRLETIAALAVRMRETVRRLSQACDSRAEQIP